MIVNKITKDYMTNSMFSNFNWLEDENWYVVEDGTELSEKIIRLCPRFDFVLDENGELVDVIEKPKTELELKQERVDEIDKELQDIDNTGLNRYLEDIIEHTGIFSLMFSTTKKVIENKKALREEREKITKEIKGGM